MDERENVGVDPWILEEELCKKCQKKKIDRSENVNSILCHDCREEQIRYPFPKKMIPAAIVVLVVLVLAMTRTPAILRMYQAYAQAEEQADNGYVYEALMGLQTVLDAYPTSIPVAVSMVDIAMEHGYYDSAAYTLNTYLEGKEVSESIYYRLDRHGEQLNSYYYTIEQVSELYNSVNEKIEQENPDEEGLRTFLAEINEQLQGMLSDSNSDKGLVYYYMASFCEDEESRAEYLKKSVEENPKLGIAEVELGTYERRKGDFESARASYNSVLRNDRSSAGALRAMGILKLLEGDKEAGLADVQMAYENNPEEDYVKETLIIALIECGQKEAAENLRQQFEEEGTEFDANFLSYLAGEVSLHDYYVD